MQKEVLRIIYSVHPRQSMDFLYNELDILKLKEITQYWLIDLCFFMKHQGLRHVVQTAQSLDSHEILHSCDSKTSTRAPRPSAGLSTHKP